MIVKYLNEGIWCFIDGVKQTKRRCIDTNLLIQQYDYDAEQGQLLPDCIHKPDSTELLPIGTQKSNKAFSKCYFSDMGLEIGDPANMKNLLSPILMEEGNYPAAMILLELDNNYLVLVTNQTVYLMNDKGQTIERLA